MIYPCAIEKLKSPIVYGRGWSTRNGATKESIRATKMDGQHLTHDSAAGPKQQIGKTPETG